MTATVPVARWRRPPPDPGHHPVWSYPKPPAPAPRPPAHNPGLLLAGQQAPHNPGLWADSPPQVAVPYSAPAAPAPPAPRSAPAPAWRPQAAAPVTPTRPVAGAATAVIWNLPPPPVQRPAISPGRFQITSPAPPPADLSDINYDPPPEAGGTGLQQTNPDGSWVVHPLSVIHRGSPIGDEGPINEAFLSTPVVYLMCGQVYSLASQVVVPNGATLYCNRAVIDHAMIHAGEGATVND